MPTLIAQDIVGVQPMTQPTGEIFTPNFMVTNTYRVMETYPDWVVVLVNNQISQWIQTMPVHLWKVHDDPGPLVSMDQYQITPALYSFLALKWPTN